MKPIKHTRHRASRLFLIALRASFLALLLFCTSHNTHSQTAIIIIDDLGYDLATGKAIAELPIPLTLAIIPFSPHAQTIAQLAKQHGKEVIIHSPMSSIDGRAIDPGGLHSDMNRAEFDQALELQLAELPEATGLNNHMGSLLTQKPEAMTWLMQQLKQRQLFFVDSRTTPESIALTTALNNQVTAWRRDVFLDHYRDPLLIENQLHVLAKKAKQQGLAVAIGHPYEETIEALNRHWQIMTDEGITLVTPSLVMKSKLLAHSVNKNYTDDQ